MVIDTERVVLLWCPNCGRPCRRRFSLFDASPPRPERMFCSCGTTVGRLARGSRQWSLEVACGSCGHWHKLTFETRRLAPAQLVSLTCPDALSELGLVGEEALVTSLETTVLEAVAKR